MLLCFCCSFFFVTAKAESTDRAIVLVGGDSNYPPYEFLNEKGEPDGYNTELTRAIAEVMGMKVEIRLGNWNSIRNQMEAGTIQVLQGMAYTEGRALTKSFSPPHTIINQSIFARKGTKQVSNIKELEGKEVILQKGGSMHDYLVHNNVNVKLIFADTHTQALRLLSSGKHDYAMVNNLPGLYFADRYDLSNIEVVGQPVRGQKYGFSVMKGNEALLARFSEGLTIVKNTGKQQEIYDKWLGALVDTTSPWRKIGLTAAIVSAFLLLLLGVIVMWNRTLSREVASRTAEMHIQQQQLIQADKMSSLGVLVSGVAHEINNPNSLMLLNLPVLKEAFEDFNEIIQTNSIEVQGVTLAGLEYNRMNKEISGLIDDMLDGTNRIQRIVDELRDFAKKDSSGSTEVLDFNQIVQTAIRLADNTILKSTTNFKVKLDPELPSVRGNAQRLEQVILNLIVNACQALKSMDRGILITTTKRRNKLIFEIKDEGEGINPENLQRVCDPFFTTKRDEGGSGLGLSVSSRIIEEHNGELLFDSIVDVGTQVTLRLPAVVRGKQIQ